MEFLAHFRASGKVFLEGVHPFVVPAGEDFLGGALNVRHMDVDVFGLPDSIQAADPLFEQFGIQRKIEKDQVVRKLKVPPFAADFRADQDLSALLLSEPGSVAVALN